MKIILFIATMLSGLNFALASANWSDLANGQHSFKTLGKDFYVDVPVRKISGATVRLAFVNRDLVKELGLELPADPAATEKMLTDLFAWEVDPTGQSGKKWFATHYLDSEEKKPGEAMGDGRALWTGELKLKTADDKILYVDGVQKGIGITPFAWLSNPGHNDGRQTMNELIISGIRSIADLKNQLDSTGDILGFTITDADGQAHSMTLRLGRQTRPAHIRYFSDEPANEQKITDYIVKRDLGLPVEAKVDDKLFLEWLQSFVLNDAEDTARVFALNAFFEQPTSGNKTTTGGSIDLNGRQYMDAYHVNLAHLFMSLKVGEQVQIQRDYIDLITDDLRRAHYRDDVNTYELRTKLKRLFNEKFAAMASRLLLHSLGLSLSEIASLKPAVRKEFYKAVNQLMRATGARKVDLYMSNNDTMPAAFDTRKILKGTLAALSHPSQRDREAAMNQLYTVDYKWNTTAPTDHLPLRARYESSVRAVVNALGGQIKPEWLQAAALRTSSHRYDSSSDGIWDQWANPIRDKATSGHSNWVEISDLMDRAGATLVDADIPARHSAMLKPKHRFSAPLCAVVFKNAG